MTDICSRCGEPDATISDPCCSAPDCEMLTAVSHYACLPPALQREEDEWQMMSDAGYEQWMDME